MGVPSTWFSVNADCFVFVFVFLSQMLQQPRLEAMLARWQQQQEPITIDVILTCCTPVFVLSTQVVRGHGSSRASRDVFFPSGFLTPHYCIFFYTGLVSELLSSLP